MSADERGVSLLEITLALAHGPLVGAQRRWPEVRHGIRIEDLDGARVAALRAACDIARAQ